MSRNFHPIIVDIAFIMDVFKRFLLASLLALSANSAQALESLSVSGGLGKPDDLRGGRVALQKHWHLHEDANLNVNLTGYWDASVALWVTDGDPERRHRDIVIGAVAPIFRLTLNHVWGGYILPFLEGSVGLAVLSSRHIGHRDLGAIVTFQDLLGGGVKFGHNKAIELSYHYLHYSNAGLFPPNTGIDVKQFITLRLYFDDV